MLGAKGRVVLPGPITTAKSADYAGTPWSFRAFVQNSTLRDTPLSARRPIAVGDCRERDMKGASVPVGAKRSFLRFKVGDQGFNAL